MNDIVINKIQSIQRCISRSREEYQKNPENFSTDLTSQDAAILNVIRACDLCIDLANILVKTYKLGIPNTSSDSFSLLEKQNIIESSLADKLKRMVSFRNTVVHEYKAVDIDIVISVIKTELNDIILFTEKTMEYLERNS